jgi:hypothetical protein
MQTGTSGALRARLKNAMARAWFRGWRAIDTRLGAGGAGDAQGWDSVILTVSLTVSAGSQRAKQRRG